MFSWIFMLALLTVLLANTILASEGDEDITNWNKTAGTTSGADTINAIAEDSQRDLYFGGSGDNLISTTSGNDWWIKKYDSKGNEDLSWNKSFSITIDNGGFQENVQDMRIDSNDNIYIVGQAYNSTPPDSSGNWWIKKFNRSGTEDTVNWNKTFTSSGRNIDDALSIAFDSNNVYIYGYMFNISQNNVNDWVIKKFNSSGTEDTTNWNKTFNTGSVNGIETWGIELDSANNVYVAGFGNNLSGSNQYEWWIQKFNSSGTEDTTSWNKTYPAGTTAPSTGGVVKIDSAGNIYVAGLAQNLVSASSGSDWWIKKFNSSGTEDTTSWNKTFGTPGSDAPFSLAIDPKNNNIYVIGMGNNLVSAASSTDWWIKKFNSSGTEDTTLWNKTYSSSESQSDTAQAAYFTIARNLFVAGRGVNFISAASGNDWWIKSFETTTYLDAPLITSPSRYQNLSGNITLNASILLNSSHGANVVNVTFRWQLTSNSAFVYNTTVHNTSTNQTIFQNTSFNTLLLADGIYNLTVIAANSSGTESADAINVTNITIDNTNPVVTASSSGVTSTAATLTATINESTNSCTYSVTNGAGSGTMTKASSTSFTATVVLLPSNDYVASLTCQDFAGNLNTNTTSFTSSAAAAASSNGGGGAGGSSGGISAGVKGQIAKEVWTSINAGEIATVKVENGAIGVTEVSFSVSNTVYGAWVQVAKKNVLPNSITDFNGKFYRKLEITKSFNLAKEGAFTDSTIKFKVEKAWLESNKLGKENIALHHYEEGKWTQLQTQVGEDDGTYVHYTAKTPGFSYFVIGEKSKEKKAEPTSVIESTEKKELPKAEALVGLAAKATTEQRGVAGQNTALTILAVVIIAMIALLSYTKRRRRRK